MRVILSSDLLDCISEVEHIRSTAYYHMISGDMGMGKYREISKACKYLDFHLKHIYIPDVVNEMNEIKKEKPINVNDYDDLFDDEGQMFNDDGVFVPKNNGGVDEDDMCTINELIEKEEREKKLKELELKEFQKLINENSGSKYNPYMPVELKYDEQDIVDGG